MALKTYEVYALVDELQQLEGAQIQKIQQPSTEELQLHLRVPGESLWLYLSVEQGLERFHLLPQKLPALPEPPSFCMRLRKELLNGRIQSIRALDGEPIVWITIQRVDLSFSLVLEMLPRKGQLFLLDQEHRLLASLHPLSLQRGLRLRDLYSPPDRMERPQETREDALVGVDFLGGQEAEENLPLDREEAIPHLRFADSLCLSTEESDRLIEARKQGEEALEEMGLAEEHMFHQWPLQWGIGQRFRQRSEKQRFQSLRQAALKSRRKQLKKAERLATALQEDLGRCQQSLEKEQDAELLKGHLHDVQRGATEVEVTDYYDPQMKKRKITLDSTLSPLENLDKLFRKIKRARKGLEATAPRLEETQKRIETLRFEIEWIEQLEDIEELLNYVPAGQEEPSSSQGTKEQQRSRPFHEFPSLQGYRILVGRSSQANDELTFRLSRGNDLWLHARGWPGSHVVIPRQKQQEPPHEVLLDAAMLAAYFSKARQQTHIDVILTQVKYVRKPKGANPGQVSVMRDQNIALRFEPERIQRLLQQSKSSEEAQT